MTGYLNISEHFGPTIQGEGRHAGQVASFLRLAGCNLSCSWCDAAYTWDWSRYNHREEVKRAPIEAPAARLAAFPGRLVVTGGEPLLQAVALESLMRHPDLTGRVWDLETNGTRPLRGTASLWGHISCSPKVIPSAGQLPHGAGTLDPDIAAHPRADFKYVVADEVDLQAVSEHVTAHDLPPDRVWLMPEGTSSDTITARTPRIAGWALDRGWNFTSRLHIYAWEDARGH